MKRVFEVRVEVPPGVPVQTMAEYIHKAVGGWTGGMDPDHPLGCKDIDPLVSYVENGVTAYVTKD